MNTTITISKRHSRGGLLETLLCGALSFGAGACALDGVDAADPTAPGEQSAEAENFTAKE